MSSNIAVKITADVASLQSNLAVARAEFTATKSSMNALAKEAASTGMNDKLRQDLAQAASNMLAAQNRVTGLANEMKALAPRATEAGSAFQGLNGIMGKFGLALGVGEVIKFGTSVFEMAANLQRQADALGVSTDQLQAFQYAARASGVETETASAALTKFYSGLGMAYEGTGPALRALQDMGLNIGKLATDQDNASATVARALLAESNQYERNAHIRELFGRSGQDVNAMLEQLAQGFDKNLEAAKRNGEYLGNDETKAALKASEQFDKAATQLEVAFTPAVVQVMHSLTGLVEIFQHIPKVTEPAGGGIGAFAATIGSAIPIIGPFVSLLDQIIAKKNQLAGGTAAKTFEPATPYRPKPSGEHTDVAGLNALDSKLRERKVLLGEIKTATETLHEAQAAGDKAGAADAQTVVNDLNKQLAGLNKTSFGGGFKDAGAELIAQARTAISAINADQTKGDAERKAEINATYAELIKSTKLNEAERLTAIKDANDAIASANKQAAAEKRQIDQATQANEQRMAQIGFDTRRTKLQEEVAAGRITKQEELTQLIQLTDDETRARLAAITAAEQGYASDTAFFIEKELEKKLAVAEAEAQKAAIRRQMEQASAQESVRTWKAVASEITGVENTFVSQMLAGRVGLFGALEQAGMQFAQREIERTIQGMTERLLLSKTELAQDQSLGQIGALMHWMFEGQKTAATQAGETARLASKQAASAAGSAADVASGSAQIMNDAHKAFSGAYQAVVGIPVVGPILAPIAGGVAFAAVAAMDSLTALDTGTNYVPRDMPAKIHEGERILPKADNAAMVAALQGKAGGGDTHTHFTYHAPEGRQTDHKDDARDMMRMIEHARRTGRLKLK